MNKEGTGILGKREINEVLREIDRHIDRSYHIIICGGAAVIAKFGIPRYTIDILDTDFDTKTFEKLVNETLKAFPSTIINDAAKIYVNELTPNFRDRLVPSDEQYNYLKVDFICKADLLSMKLLALRDEDMEDIIKLGVEKNDLPIIYSNILNYAKISSACIDEIMMNAHIINNFKVARALNALSNLGIPNPSPPENIDEIKTLLDLIQFHEVNTGKIPEFSDVKEWQKEILRKTQPSEIARRIKNKKQVSNDISDNGVFSL